MADPEYSIFASAGGVARSHSARQFASNGEGTDVNPAVSGDTYT